jgi:Mrp family chromosome partitioning ATPase
VPEEGELLIGTAIACSLAQIGRRTLILDLSGKTLKNESPSNSRTVENILDSLEYHPLQLDGHLTVRSGLGSGENESPVTSPNFLGLLEQAREQYDLIIVKTPPVMIGADALYLGRHADFVLHVVRWNSTPRRAVLAALDRLRNFSIPVNGVVLSRINEKEYRRLTGVHTRVLEADKSQRKRSRWNAGRNFSEPTLARPTLTAGVGAIFARHEARSQKG